MAGVPAAKLARPNVWSLQRDVEIKALLLKLLHSLGEDSFVIDTDTSVNEQSVYIAHPTMAQVRAYLYTYGQTPGYYGVHLEHPPEAVEAAFYDVYENISYPRLVEMLTVHFNEFTSE